MLTAYIRKSDDEIIYDLTDLEQVLKVSRRTLFKWRADGVLPLTELGGKLYISKRRLFELIESWKIQCKLPPKTKAILPP